MISLTDLPTDVLYSIFPYLNATDFLALTSSTTKLQTYQQDPSFWRFLTRTTFRIPPQPLLQADGARWQWLYRRLRTQTQLYTWGSNGCGNTGHGFSISSQSSTLEVDFSVRNVGWPRRVPLELMQEDIGIVADVQCGGWSTTILNSIGCLYICGAINENMSHRVRRLRGSSRAGPQAMRLDFPSAYPPTTKNRYEPSTAIAQFSTGRKHVLGLADDGKVWQWNTNQARLIKPLHVDVGEKRVSRVVAGWDRASMYVLNIGIVYWPDVFVSQPEALEADTTVTETATVPGTSLSSTTSNREATATLESRIGQVVNHVVLENYIIFTTKLNKIFFYRADFPLPDFEPPEPLELAAFYSTAADVPFEVQDLQGSFRSFAIFSKSGGVLMGDRAMLDDIYHATYGGESRGLPPPQPRVVPTLQSNGVISIAFGDHHFQALRSDGTILAYGTDSQGCGALGLGFNEGTGPLRGLLSTDWSSNGTLGHDIGRQVWFDPMMHHWLAEMKEKAGIEGEQKARGDLILPARALPIRARPVQNAAAIKAVGDYFEREGRKWEDGVTEAGEMRSYFVLKVAAAGWHSAALVLVDEEKAERARQMHIIPPEEAEEEAAKVDHHGGTWEDIDAPWDQLSKALVGFADWLWGLGRTFLGLTARDGVPGTNGAEQEEDEVGREKVKYTWSDQPFPRLRMADGTVMPGEIDITE